MALKVITLNMWRYFDWEIRKNKLIKFLKDEDADIVFLQEAAYDERLKDKWKNQVEEINEVLNYKDCTYGKCRDMTKWHNDPIDWKMNYGFGILSKFRIKSKEVIILPFIEKEKESGFMHIQLETSEGKIDLVNVHFENTDKGSEEHLKQTLEWCKDRKIKPIIAGDFNMHNTEVLIGLADEEYEISYKKKKYISYMPTEHSYIKIPITLDYVIVHREKFKMKKVKCVDNKVSDHSPVIAEVEKI